MQHYDAIVLAGGAGRRLGGVDKAALEVGDTPLLSRALEAVASADRIVVVGASQPGAVDVVAVREEPPGGGPVAALAAGLAQVGSELVVVLACDMPFVSAAVVQRLVEIATGARGEARPVDVRPAGGEGGHTLSGSAPDVVMLVDAEGRRQFLAAVYRTGPLRRELGRLGSPDGAAMRQVVGGLTVSEVTTDPEVTLDCDTWADVEHSRDLLEGR